MFQESLQPEEQRLPASPPPGEAGGAECNGKLPETGASSDGTAGLAAQPDDMENLSFPERTPLRDGQQDSQSARTDPVDSSATPDSGEHEPVHMPEAGLSPEELSLVNEPLPSPADPVQMEALWNDYQKTIGALILRMGSERSLGDSISRLPWVTDMDGLYSRLALIPKLGQSALWHFGNNGLANMVNKVAGECSLMELSAAAGYRTFCLPALVRGLLKSAKMRDKSVSRMFDTFEFLNTMIQYPMNDHRVLAQLERTNGLHARYKVAGAVSQPERDLFKYIALNMFYIGPSMRPDLTPQERHAICGLTVLVASRMGHRIEGSVKELEAFIADYESKNMFSRDDSSVLRKRAVEIARASKIALDKIPVISPARIHSFVPHRVKEILKLD
jgi:hypothetical protein